MTNKSKTKNNVYDKIEKIITEKIFSLESENSQLKNELAYCKAKLEVYERIASISNQKVTLGFGPPIEKGGNE